MIEIQLAGRVLDNGKVIRGKKGEFESGYAAWRFFETEKPGQIEREIGRLQKRDEKRGKNRYNITTKEEAKEE